MSILKENYKKLLPYIEDMIKEGKDYKRYIAGECFMPLVIEILSERENNTYIFSITHYVKINGDSCCDPDMQVEVDIEKEEVKPLTYQQDLMGIYQEVYFEEDGIKYKYPKLEKSLNEFLSLWLDNIKNQGYVLEADSIL